MVKTNIGVTLNSSETQNASWWKAGKRILTKSYTPQLCPLDGHDVNVYQVFIALVPFCS